MERHDLKGSLPRGTFFRSNIHREGDRASVRPDVYVLRARHIQSRPSRDRHFPGNMEIGHPPTDFFLESWIFDIQEPCFLESIEFGPPGTVFLKALKLDLQEDIFCGGLGWNLQKMSPSTFRLWNHCTGSFFGSRLGTTLCGPQKTSGILDNAIIEFWSQILVQS